MDRPCVTPQGESANRGALFVCWVVFPFADFALQRGFRELSLSKGIDCGGRCWGPGGDPAAGVGFDFDTGILAYFEQFPVGFPLLEGLCPHPRDLTLSQSPKILRMKNGRKPQGADDKTDKLYKQINMIKNNYGNL